jgi:two-component system chemotaxis sensor kinase CheA
VIKNLEANFAKVPGISGATILGDGSVALILDVHALTRLANQARPEKITEPSSEPLARTA